VAGWRDTELSLAGESSVERIRTGIITRRCWLLGASPLLGTNFTAEDARANTTVMLSYGFWQERFGGARDVVGKQIAIGGRSRTVIAVMPRGFEFPTSETRIWTPFELGPYYFSSGPDRGYRIQRFNGIARLKPGVTPAQAIAEGSAPARRQNSTTTSCRRSSRPRWRQHHGCPAARLGRPGRQAGAVDSAGGRRAAVCRGDRHRREPAAVASDRRRRESRSDRRLAPAPAGSRASCSLKR
jgi:hypothetical protein